MFTFKDTSYRNASDEHKKTMITVVAYKKLNQGSYAHLPANVAHRMKNSQFPFLYVEHSSPEFSFGWYESKSEVKVVAAAYGVDVYEWPGLSIPALHISSKQFSSLVRLS